MRLLKSFRARSGGITYMVSLSEDGTLTLCFEEEKEATARSCYYNQVTEAERVYETGKGWFRTMGFVVQEMRQATELG